jgi:protein-S-isoprenylcysteine O-methyltransferase Ste14
MIASEHPELMRKLFSRTLISLLILGLVLFAAAGSLDWPAAWIYLLLFAASSLGGGFWLARHDPELLKERLGSLFQREQKPWDRIFMGAMLALWVSWLVLMGLDARRYHWSAVPLYANIAGLALICLGAWLVWLTFKTNSYAAPVVKIQRERAHRVVSEGPYAYVRHPMYAGALLFLLGMPLLLGSWWGLAAGAGFIVLIAVRAMLEERTLAAELDGYSDYAKRVRYRLVPHIW